MLPARFASRIFWVNRTSFNGHPPLGVNATLGFDPDILRPERISFQWAPTLGGECYWENRSSPREGNPPRFNGHPPLGVNATRPAFSPTGRRLDRFNGYPPLGVNATFDGPERNVEGYRRRVSMGTHPWG